jgi:hypothetical protein
MKAPTDWIEFLPTGDVAGRPSVGTGDEVLAGNQIGPHWMQSKARFRHRLDPLPARSRRSAGRAESGTWRTSFGFPQNCNAAEVVSADLLPRTGEREPSLARSSRQGKVAERCVAVLVVNGTLRERHWAGHVAHLPLSGDPHRAEAGTVAFRASAAGRIRLDLGICDHWHTSYASSRVVCIYFDLIVEQMQLKLYRDADNAATVAMCLRFGSRKPPSSLG